ncbi:hypothetical protein [Alloscardovia venturai]|uniref:hypothetical protein n=1 Tax=Alloscardovia venturai TaxID=1769421 RepID=UPI00366DF8CA
MKPVFAGVTSEVQKVFQTDYAGSIPVIRSTSQPNVSKASQAFHNHRRLCSFLQVFRLFPTISAVKYTPKYTPTLALPAPEKNRADSKKRSTQMTTKYTTRRENGTGTLWQDDKGKSGLIIRHYS